MEREISGYYYDGEKSYVLYKDEDGNETMEEDNDEQSDQNGSKEEIGGRDRRCKVQDQMLQRSRAYHT